MTLDLRFYEWTEDARLGSLADILGNDTLALHASLAILGLSPVRNARAGDLCFFDARTVQDDALTQEAAICLIPPRLEGKLPAGPVYIVNPRPRAAFALAAARLARIRRWHTGDALVHPEAVIDPSATIGVHTCIGAGAHVDAGTLIGPGSVIGPGVQVGRNCQIGAHASIQAALIGDEVRIASGTRIGEAGFGTVAGAEGAEDMPQFGRVVIQDHVSIGANVCIDRGAFDDTVIGERTKIDNLCQIGHNVVIGRNVVMAAFAGLSGTVSVGDGAMLGGRVGIADHIEIGKGAILAADSAIMRDVPAGETWGGSPARPLKQWMRETAWLRRQAGTHRSGEKS